jgi:hypothetical protein
METPRLSSVPTESTLAPGLQLPAISGSAPPSPEAVKAESNIKSSLASLQAMPPSPRLSSSLSGSGAPSSLEFPSSPSLDRLPGFSGSGSQGPVSLPTIPSTGELSTATDMKPLSSLADMDTTLDFQDYQGMLESKGVEQTLADSGYLPVDKILTKDDNNMLMCQYIKAIDSTGRTTFVDMDCEGFVSVDKDTMTMAKVSNASIVPYSMKMGAYECASSDVCGVAFECEDGICTVKRSHSDLNPSETVFAQVHSPKSEGHKSHGLLYGHPVPYPIVTLSDIKENPNQVSCSIKDSHNRMRNISFNQANKDTKELLAATNELNQEVQRFDNNQKVISSKLSTTIKQFEDLHDHFKRHPPTTDKKKELQRSVHYNLRKRNDMVIDHIQYSEAVNSRIEKIKELTGEIRNLNDYAEQLFSGLDYEYKE